MADNPPQHVIAVYENQDEVDNLELEINGILNIPIIEIREEANDNNPWINLAQVGQQRLAIAGNNIPVVVDDHNQYRFATLGNNYRVRGRPVVYGEGEQQWLMIETNFPDNHYGPQFSYGIHGCGGPQAQGIVDANDDHLVFIDKLTAIRLRNQLTNRANEKSIIYWLVRSAQQIAVLAQHLYVWCDENANDQQTLDFRRRVYEFGNRCINQLCRAIRSQNIYRKAIVVVEAMNLLQLVDPEPPFYDPLPPNLAPIPDIAVPNMQQSVARVTAFVNDIIFSELFTRNWQQMFDEMANHNTSVPIVGQLGQIPGQVLAEQMIRLTNNQEFMVRVEALVLDDDIGWLYCVRSPAFTDTFENIYPIWPVVNYEPYEVLRSTDELGNFLPLHSHGLAGSYYANDIQGGNNGFQVTTINFPDVEGLDHRRLYFMNREMAMELRHLFEIQTPSLMTQYHRWFVQLIELSRMVCDLRQWYRGLANVVDDDQWLEDIQFCFQRLQAIPVQLFDRYDIICRLEQLWNHSLLVPHIQNGEPIVQILRAQPDMYFGSKSGNDIQMNPLVDYPEGQHHHHQQQQQQPGQSTKKLRTK